MSDDTFRQEQENAAANLFAYAVSWGEYEHANQILEMLWSDNA